MRGQIIIIKFGVTDGSYQYMGLWSQFVGSNANACGLFIPLEEKIQRKKRRAFYNWKVIKPIFLSTFHHYHHSIMTNPGTLPHLVFIMILSMGTQRGSINLCIVISLYMNRKHVVRIDDCLLE